MIWARRLVWLVYWLFESGFDRSQLPSSLARVLLILAACMLPSPSHRQTAQATRVTCKLSQLETILPLIMKGGLELSSPRTRGQR